MLAVPWDQPFDDPEWGFELKWDGVRALVYSDNETVRLVSRNGNELSARYPVLASMALPHCVLDGEVVALDEKGQPSFARLAADPDGSPLVFVAFDLLELDGATVTSLPLLERRQHLTEVADQTAIAVNDLTVGEGVGLFEAVAAADLEGVVAKRLDAPYQVGVRSPHWRKILNLQTARCLVLGYTRSGSGLPFAALVLGLLDGALIRYVGRVGSGFSERDRAAIRDALDQMPGPAIDADIDEQVVWCEPHLVAHIEFRAWTGSGRLRGPVFKGFGAEPPEEASWDTEGPIG